MNDVRHQKGKKPILALHVSGSVSIDEMQRMQGFVPHLVEAAKRGSLPLVEDFREFLRLPMLDKVILVDYAVMTPILIKRASLDLIDPKIEGLLPASGIGKRKIRYRMFATDDAMAEAKYTPATGVQGLWYAGHFPLDQQRCGYVCKGTSNGDAVNLGYVLFAGQNSWRGAPAKRWAEITTRMSGHMLLGVQEIDWE